MSTKPMTRILFAPSTSFDLLKATVKKTITVPGHYRADGTFVHPHQKVVHVNPEVSNHAVASGQGSHSQKAAHKVLSADADWWNTLSIDDKAAHVMSLATDKQNAASASAAVSGWKAAAGAGKNPTEPQWKAFLSLPWEKQAPLYDQAKAKAGGLAHLTMPKAVPLPAAPDPALAVPANNAQKLDKKQPMAGVSIADTAINSVAEKVEPTAAPVEKSGKKEADAAIAFEAMATGSFYQKVAYQKMKDAHGDKVPASVMLEMAQSLYTQLQGAASAAAAVSMFKKSALAGKVPSPAQVKAYFALSDYKQIDIGIEIKKVIGYKKWFDLLNTVKAPSTAAGVFPPSKPGAGGDLPVPKPSLKGKPAYDHVAQAMAEAKETDKTNNSPTHGVKANAAVQSAVAWLKANKGAKAHAEMDEALISLGMGHLWMQVGLPSSSYSPISSPAPATSAAPVTVDASLYHNTTDGHNKFWAVSTHGKVMKTTYGKIKTAGSSSEKVFGSESDAKMAASKLAAEKMKSGYKLQFGHAEHKYHDKPPAVAAIAKQFKVPQDGDTKTGTDGGQLVFKNGRWHKVKVAAGDLPVPDFSGDGSKYAKAYANFALALKEAHANGGVAGVKKYVTVHKTGSKAGGFTLKDVNTILRIPGNPVEPRHIKMHAYVTALLDGNSPMVKKVTASKATAKPIAKPVTMPGGGTNIDGWTQVGPQQGSNPGGKFKDAAGAEWYCKFPENADIAKNELLSAKFYQMLGVNGPNIKLVNKGGKVGVAAKWVDVKKGSPAQLTKAKGAHDAFVIDAWLANWDVVGAEYDNLMLGKNGEAVRVDVGGSLLYRAQGSPKGDAFGSEVTELAVLLDAGTNAQSAAVFGGISKASMSWGLNQLAKMKPSQIVELCEKAGPGSEKVRADLATTLIARRANILKKMGVPDPWDKPKVDESNLKVRASYLPKPIDFANFNGSGKGLSSVAKVNEQNSIDSAALVAFAAQGNLTALKNYQYDAFNKETGAPIGKKPITEHPAKDIKAQWAGLVETLSSIAYPPVDSLEMVSSGVASSLEELADGAGYFKPEDRVETVSADHRMGFFMKLGAVDDVKDLLAGYKWSFLTPSSKWVKDAKAGFSSLSNAVRAYIGGVQSSGWVNHVFSQGKETVSVSGKNGASYAGGVQTLASKIYAEAALIPSGTVLHRFMEDTTAGKSMTQQFLNAKPGLIIQNTDSMCASYNEAHTWSGDVHLKIRCAEGSKGTPSFASGAYSSEHEVTTLPGQRFVVLEVVKKGDNKVMVDVLMLPPHDGYVTALGKLAVLGKSMVLFMDKSWLKTK
jgi:predicted DNA-binding WGR domain protein